MSTTKDARNDAREYARAQMFYGDGAGTRRKLIQATVDARAHKDPQYARAFRAELARQDMAEHAQKARVERSRKDRRAAVSRNVRGALTGNNRSLNTSVLVLATVAYVAHQTGYDKKIIAKSRKVYADLRTRRNRKHVRAVYDDLNIS